MAIETDPGPIDPPPVQPRPTAIGTEEMARRHMRGVDLGLVGVELLDFTRVGTHDSRPAAPGLAGDLAGSSAWLSTLLDDTVTMAAGRPLRLDPAACDNAPHGRHPEGTGGPPPGGILSPVNPEHWIPPRFDPGQADLSPRPYELPSLSLYYTIQSRVDALRSQIISIAFLAGTFDVSEAGICLDKAEEEGLDTRSGRSAIAGLLAIRSFLIDLERWPVASDPLRPALDLFAQLARDGRSVKALFAAADLLEGMAPSDPPDADAGVGTEGDGDEARRYSAYVRRAARLIGGLPDAAGTGLRAEG